MSPLGICRTVEVKGTNQIYDDDDHDHDDDNEDDEIGRKLL